MALSDILRDIVLTPSLLHVPTLQPKLRNWLLQVSHCLTDYTIMMITLYKKNIVSTSCAKALNFSYQPN